jgi:hypothetical protein
MSHTIETPTPEQTAYERAARIMAEKVDVDPEQLVPVPPPEFAILTPGMQYVRYQWTIIADDMMHLSWMLASIREASEAKLN